MKVYVSLCCNFKLFVFCVYVCVCVCARLHVCVHLFAVCEHLQRELLKKHKDISQSVSDVETAIEKLQNNSDLIKVTLKGPANKDIKFLTQNSLN